MMKKKVNLKMLTHALHQQGPWKGQDVQVDLPWLKKELALKIKRIDWRVAKDDVQRFLSPQKRKSLEFWNEGFFTEAANRL